MHTDTAVKYLVNVLARACLVQLRVPLAPEALTSEQVARLNDAYAAATELVRQERDAIALEVQMRGVCPWCNDARHDGDCAVQG